MASGLLSQVEFLIMLAAALRYRGAEDLVAWHRGRTNC